MLSKTMMAEMNILRNDNLKDRVDSQSKHVLRKVELEVSRRNLSETLSQDWQEVVKHFDDAFFKSLWEWFWKTVQRMKNITKAWLCALKYYKHEITWRIKFSPEELESFKWLTAEQVKKYMKIGLVSTRTETNPKKLDEAVNAFVDEYPELTSSWVTITWDNNVVNIHRWESWMKIAA